MSIITIGSEKLTVKISTFGAELQSIVDENGVERLWQGDPAFWTGRAPILFPVAGGLKDDCFEMNGVTYPMPKHGFVRKLEWKVESQEKDKAVFLMDQKDAGFPFDYEFRAAFTVKGNALTVSYDIKSLDDRAFWFGLGAHEAYATPEGIDKYTIEFEQEEKLDNYVLEGNFTKHEFVCMAESTKELPLDYKYFAVDALVFRTVKSRAVTLGSSVHNRKIRVEFPDHPVLMFWTKPGAGYICIEPWCNGPDFTDAQHDASTKPGFMKLEKGQSIERHHIITVL